MYIIWDRDDSLKKPIDIVEGTLSIVPWLKYFNWSDYECKLISVNGEKV